MCNVCLELETTLSVFLTIYLSIYQSTSLLPYQSIYSSIFLSIHVFVFSPLLFLSATKILHCHALPYNLGKLDHAMYSIKRSMQWDEDVFGLECDLDLYNIVATNDFNMGAM